MTGPSGCSLEPPQLSGAAALAATVTRTRAKSLIMMVSLVEGDRG